MSLMNFTKETNGAATSNDPGCRWRCNSAGVLWDRPNAHTGNVRRIDRTIVAQLPRPATATTLEGKVINSDRILLINNTLKC